MKTRLFFISLLVPVMVLCTPPATDNQGQNTTPATPTENPDDAIDPEVKNGDRILVTNEIIEKFITTEKNNYKERDYSYSAMKKGAEADYLIKEIYQDESGATQRKLYISPGNCDLPPVFTVRWPKDTKNKEYTGKLVENGAKTLEYTLDPNPDLEVSFGYWKLTNLLPNAHYSYEVKNGSELVTSGEFDTYGSLHQLSFKPSSSQGVRNVRDLGGWVTEDGSKMVRYRMVYRGGRPEKISKLGLQQAKDEGIKAEVDLRGKSDVIFNRELAENAGKTIADDKKPFGPESFYCAPVIEEGYKTMLRDDQARTKEVIEFIMDCVANDRPVYFHCSLGRDRTGTTALLILGILGVYEGHISVDYEITQFAPTGYSVSGGETTRMTRLSGVDYDGAAKYLWEFGKKTDGTYEPFATCVQKYMNSIGITDDKITAFRNKMLVPVS